MSNMDILQIRNVFSFRRNILRLSLFLHGNNYPVKRPRCTKKFKDFLLLYNQISETCFTRCTSSFFSREVTNAEDECIQNCTQKHIHANHKIMEAYVEIQPVLVQRRIDEVANAQATLKPGEINDAQPEKT